MRVVMIGLTYLMLGISFIGNAIMYFQDQRLVSGAFIALFGCIFLYIGAKKMNLISKK